METTAYLTEESARKIFREESQEAAAHVLEEAKGLRSLLSVSDVARTLNVSRRTVETHCAAGEFPPPLWIGGQRRWHPDTIQAFLRSANRLRRSNN